MAGKRIPLEQRLEERTSKDGDCLIWNGQLASDGYPSMTFRHGGTKRGTRAVWEHFRGPIPAGLLVCHTCDTPRCVNVEHLFLGTPKENTQDMIRKGRRAHMGGERHGCARLTDEQVDSIRAERAKGFTLAHIAGVFGVSFQHISLICRFKTRKERTPRCA